MSENIDDQPDGKTYPIRTLQDIYNLPTLRQVRICLEELAEAMLLARATNDLVVEMMREKGHEVKQAATWPEVSDWKDDGKGECSAKVIDPTGTLPDLDLPTIKLGKEPT